MCSYFFIISCIVIANYLCLKIKISFTSFYALDKFLLLGGHDDKKVMIPTQVILANLFSPAELRVSNYGNMLDMPFSYGTDALFQIAPIGFVFYRNFLAHVGFIKNEVSDDCRMMKPFFLNLKKMLEMNA